MESYGTVLEEQCILCSQEHSNFRTAVCVFKTFVCLCGLQGLSFLCYGSTYSTVIRFLFWVNLCMSLRTARVMWFYWNMCVFVQINLCMF